MIITANRTGYFMDRCHGARLEASHAKFSKSDEEDFNSRGVVDRAWHGMTASQLIQKGREGAIITGLIHEYDLMTIN